MTRSQARQLAEDLPPTGDGDPVLRNKLAARFGAKLLKQGFTALPVLVQRYYRYVPGNALYEYEHFYDKESRSWVRVPESRRLVCEESHMTPTEYALMTAIWSYWWTHESDPWPSVEHLMEHLGKSERTVRRLLQRLRDKGFMLSVEQYNYERKQISNRYDFSPFLRRLADYLDALEQPAKPNKPVGEGVKTGGQSVPDSAPSGCQNGQGIENESKSNFSDKDKSDSSGSAASSKGTDLPSAPACSHIAHATIGNTKGDTESPNQVESHRTSNRPAPEKGVTGAASAKGVEGDITGRKPSKYEEFVLASGVPLPRLYALETWLQQHARPAETPLLVEALIDPISQTFANGHLMVANRTQAAKLYQYAREQGRFAQEELEDAFREWVHTAAKHIPPNVERKMAWFFRAVKVELLKWLLARSPTEEQNDSPESGQPSEEGTALPHVGEAVVSPTSSDQAAAGEPIIESADLRDFWRYGGAQGLEAAGYRHVDLDGDLLTCQAYEQRRRQSLEPMLAAEPSALSPEAEYEVQTYLEWVGQLARSPEQEAEQPQAAVPAPNKEEADVPPKAEEQETPRREQPAGQQQAAQVEPERVMILCEDPSLGWSSQQNADWWADRLRDEQDPAHTHSSYEVLPTAHGRWGFVFRRRGTAKEWFFLSVDEVRPFLRAKGGYRELLE